MKIPEFLLKCSILFILLFSQMAIAQTPTNSMLEQKLDAALSSYFPEGQPGGSVWIQQGDQVLYAKSFGVADINTKVPFTSQTVQNTGSITKTFVSYGILILANEKKLSLDDNLLKYFPEFKNKKLGKQITLKHLLTHTSGLPDSRKVDENETFYLTADDAQNWAPLLETETLKFPVGSRYEYSNPVYNGLAIIIEKVSGMNWREFIKQRIFIPCGMMDSKITDGAYPDKDVAHAYHKVNGQWEEYDYGEVPTFCAAGNGGIWCSIEDLKKYLKGINQYTFLPKNVMEKSFETWTPASWNMPYPSYRSMVWFVHPGHTFDSKTSEKDWVFEHSGSQGGFRAHFIVVPSKHISVIWLTNNDLTITKPIWNVLKEEKIVE